MHDLGPLEYGNQIGAPGKEFVFDLDGDTTLLLSGLAMSLKKQGIFLNVLDVCLEHPQRQSVGQPLNSPDAVVPTTRVRRAQSPRARSRASPPCMPRRL